MYSTPGMTLRDWFAGQALASALSGAANLDKATPEQRAEAFKMLAGFLYEIADAMLTERNRTNG